MLHPTFYIYSACCPTCRSLYSQPDARLFAACGTDDPVVFTSKVSPAAVAPGRIVKYTAKITNRGGGPAAAAQGLLGFAVRLPQGSTLVSTKRAIKKLAGAAIKVGSGVVAWEGFGLARGKNVKLKLKVRMQRGGGAGGGGAAAAFGASLYRVLPAGGAGYCSSAARNQSVGIPKMESMGRSGGKGK